MTQRLIPIRLAALAADDARRVRFQPKGLGADSGMPGVFHPELSGFGLQNVAAGSLYRGSQ